MDNRIIIANNISLILKEANWTKSDIDRIYYGGDHVCRCGCAGNYFEKGSRGYTRHLNSLVNHTATIRPAGEVHYSRYRGDDVVCEGIDIGPNYINIPIANTEDKCICLYKKA